MDDLENKIKQLVPEARNVGRLAEIIRVLLENNAIERQKAMSTTRIKKIMKFNPLACLKSLEKRQVVKRARKSSSCFIFSESGKDKEKFLHTKDEIRKARIRSVILLTEVLSTDKYSLDICVKVLGLRKTSSVDEVLEKIVYNSNRDEEKLSLLRYNVVISELKEQNRLPTSIGRLLWRRGGHLWYVCIDF